MKYIVEYKKYNKPSRGESISLEEAKDFISKNCYMGLNPIYRGVEIGKKYKGNDYDISDYNIMKIDPSKHNRRPGYSVSSPYLNFIFDHPEWQDYPDKRKSLVCSTSYGTAALYGDVYFVFPLKGAKMGVCPRSDFQISFPEFSNYTGVPIHKLYKVIEGSEEGDTFESIIQKVRGLDFLSYESMSEKISGIYGFNYTSYETFMYEFEKMSPQERVDKFLKISSPQENGFSLMSTREYAKDDTPVNREIWLESESVMINFELLNSMYGDEYSATKNVYLSFINSLSKN